MDDCHVKLRRSIQVLGITNFLILLFENLGITGPMPLILYGKYEIPYCMLNSVDLLLISRVRLRRRGLGYIRDVHL